MSEKGYFNLTNWSARWLHGFYYEARVDLEHPRFSDDLICLTAPDRMASSTGTCSSVPKRKPIGRRTAQGHLR